MTSTKLRRGYSLIELTIVVGLVSILSITISAIVLTAISSSARIKNKIRVKQTGDYAIGQIQTMVRNAREVSSCDSANNTLTLINQDSRTTQIALENDQIASNSGIYLTPDDISVSTYDLVCLPSDNQPQLIQLTFTLGKADASLLREVESPSQMFSLSAEIRND